MIYFARFCFLCHIAIYLLIDDLKFLEIWFLYLSTIIWEMFSSRALTAMRDPGRMVNQNEALKLWFDLPCRHADPSGEHSSTSHEWAGRRLVLPWVLTQCGWSQDWWQPTPCLYKSNPWGANTQSPPKSLQVEIDNPAAHLQDRGLENPWEERGWTLVPSLLEAGGICPQHPQSHQHLQCPLQCPWVID